MKLINDYIQFELENLSNPEPKIAIVGDLNYDYIYISPPLESGKEVLISDFTRSLAGAAGYVASGLAKLGAKVHLLTQVGDDKDGKDLLKEISSAGVIIDGIRIANGRKSAFTLIFTDKTENRPRQVATYQGTLKDLSIDYFKYEELLNQSDLVYSCNYFILPRLREEIPYLFRYAKKINILTAYDANSGYGWEDRKRLETLKKRIYPHTDLIFLNESEAYHLTGIKDPMKSIKIISPNSNTVIIKLGEKGVLARHLSKIYEVNVFPIQDKVKDTVGAGDSFQAAFIYFFLRRLPIEICTILAEANAASTVQYYGGTKGQLNLDGVKNFIKRYKIYDEGNGKIMIK